MSCGLWVTPLYTPAPRPVLLREQNSQSRPPLNKGKSRAADWLGGTDSLASAHSSQSGSLSLCLSWGLQPGCVWRIHIHGM